MDKFSALADPTRRSIVELLAQRGRLPASEISAQFPVSPPAISQHLKVLREAGLVRMEKRAQQRIYEVNPDALLELEDWARRLTQLWDQRFDALERVLAAEKQKIIESERIRNMTGQNNRDVTITRIFDAPRDLVYQAWTDPKTVAQWWGPTYFTNPVCEMDVRPGGALLIHMQAPDGVVYPDKGIFQEVVPPERLVFTSTAFEEENGQPQLEVLVTVTFAEHGAGQTKLTLLAQVIRATPEVQGALSGMEEGWNQSLDKLAGLLIKA